MTLRGILALLSLAFLCFELLLDPSTPFVREQPASSEWSHVAGTGVMHVAVPQPVSSRAIQPILLLAAHPTARNALALVPPPQARALRACRTSPPRRQLHSPLRLCPPGSDEDSWPVRA